LRFSRALFPAWIILWLTTGFLWAQENDAAIKVKTSLDKKRVGIGDKLKYSITIVTSKDTEIEFPDTSSLFKDFSVKDSGLTTRTFFRKKTLAQSYLLQTYTPGKYTLPKTAIRYRAKGQSQWQELGLSEYTVEVKSALEKAGSLVTLRDIKGPLEMSRRLDIFLVSGVLIFLAILAFALAFLYRKKDTSAVACKRLAHEIAYEQLQALKQKDLIRQGKIKEYYSEISDIIRRYLENRFLLKAPEMTTEEFLLYVRDYSQLISGHKTLLKEFLSACDLVKFAKYTPSVQEIEAIFVSAERFIDQTKEEKLLAP